MKRRLSGVVLAWALFVPAEEALAQASAAPGTDYAIGIGLGLDKVEDRGVFYASGSFRFSPWRDEERGVEKALALRGRSRMRGFLEAEVGYWKDSELSPFESDLLLGLNVLAVLPSRPVDVFFGGGLGVHFLTASPPLGEGGPAENQQSLGGNIQFGVDLNISDPFSVFALGRFDILQGDAADFQSKVQLGGRYKF